MPELPEAETIAKQLQARLAGRRLAEVRAVRNDIVHGEGKSLRKVLPGLRVERVYRRAKRVVLELSGAESRQTALVFTLGMTGRVTVNAVQDPVEKHTHLRVAVSGADEELRFCDPRRFGGVWFLTDEGTAPDARSAGRRGKQAQEQSRKRELGPVGPEPLELRLAEFQLLLLRKRAVKALLMDQTIIAGLGNIYCDESLFAAGIHPLRRADSLNDEEAKRLLRTIKSTLRRAIKFNGSTLMDYRGADGERGSFQRFHRVYGRGGKPCRSCESTIERIVVAGRSTCLCPVCQSADTRRRRPAPSAKKRKTASRTRRILT